MKFKRLNSVQNSTVSKFLLPLLLSVLILPALVQHTIAKALQPDLEIIHNWSTVSETNAINSLIASVKTQNISIRTKHIPFRESREYVSERLANGYPPSAIQWMPNKELFFLSEFGVLHYLNDIASSTKWSSRIYPTVLSDISKEGKIWALPLNIHTRNMFWINRKIFNELNIVPPKTWQDFLKIATIIKKAGYEPMVMGQNITNKSLLWSSILLSQVGTKQYKDLLSNTIKIDLLQPTLKQTFDLLNEIKPHIYNNPNMSIGVSELFKTHKAATWLTGDWAKAELKASGLEYGKDYTCTMAPDNANISIYSIDAFIFPRGGDIPLATLSENFITPLLTQEAQLKFNIEKGSIPVLKSIDISTLDECAKLAWRVAQKQNGLVPSFASLTDDIVAFLLESTIEAYWHGEISSAEAVSILTSELHALRGKKAGRMR